MNPWADADTDDGSLEPNTAAEMNPWADADTDDGSLEPNTAWEVVQIWLTRVCGMLHHAW
jgi:hypothetical protein